MRFYDNETLAPYLLKILEQDCDRFIHSFAAILATTEGAFLFSDNIMEAMVMDEDANTFRLLAKGAKNQGLTGRYFGIRGNSTQKSDEIAQQFAGLDQEMLPIPLASSSSEENTKIIAASVTPIAAVALISGITALILYNRYRSNS